MLASIRRFKLVVIALAIVGLGTGIGVSVAQHTYQSHSVLLTHGGPQVRSLRAIVASGGFWRSVVGAHPDMMNRMNGHPGWIVLPGTADEVKSHVTTQPVTASGHFFTITATASTPHEAASLVRTVTRDFANYMSPGSKTWLRVLIYATNPVTISSPFAQYGSTGLGLGLALGLLLAAAFGAFPGGTLRRPALGGA